MGANEKIVFSPDFRVDLSDRSEVNLSIGIVSPLYKQKISQGLRDLSVESIRNRFQAPKKEFSDEELNYLTSLDGHNHFAMGIEELDGPHRGVAVVRIVRSKTDPEEAELAITIIDAYQGQGLGTLLLKLMILAALERHIKRLSFTFVPTNEGILRLIKKVGNTYPGNQGHDAIQLKMDLSQFRRPI